MKLLQGDAIEQIRELPAKSFDGCLCDPPYGLTERRTPQRASGTMNRTGFMHMKWDSAVPPAETWAAVLRVLKPGAFMLAFGGTRTYHRLACAIEDAGFEIRDCIMWLYGSGFPKHGSCLKPAWEPIIVARKSGRGLLNIDGCRIGPPTNTIRSKGRNPSASSAFPHSDDCWVPHLTQAGRDDVGRWPANVILDEEAAAALDEQSGTLTSGNNPTRRSAAKTPNVFARFQGQPDCIAHRGEDSGGASRFFYCAKASRKERGDGNTHPTVKPLKLTEYLARLILPGKNARLIVPFAGSGSEMLGAKQAGWSEIVGIERDASYTEIARKRLGIRVKVA